MKTLQLFEALDRLQKLGKPLSAEVLEQTMRAALRSVHDDITALQAMNELAGDAAAYPFKDEFLFQPLHFNGAELDAIVRGMHWLIASDDTELGFAAESVLAKIAAITPPKAPRRAASAGSADSRKAKALLSALRAAVRQRNVLDLIYTDLEGKRSHRLVHPLGLTQFDCAWVLTAWCLSRQDFRNFRVDLITKAEPTGEVFAHQTGQRFSDYLKLL